MSYSHAGGHRMDIKQPIVEIKVAKDGMVFSLTCWTVAKEVNFTRNWDLILIGPWLHQTIGNSIYRYWNDVPDSNVGWPNVAQRRNSLPDVEPTLPNLHCFLGLVVEHVLRGKPQHSQSHVWVYPDNTDSQVINSTDAGLVGVDRCGHDIDDAHKICQLSYL